MSFYAFFKKNSRAVLLGALIAVFVATLAPARAQRSGWSAPQRLSDTGHLSWFPALATDRTGAVHIVFASSVIEPDGDILHDLVEYLPLREGRTTAARNDVMATVVTNNESYAARPSLVVAANGVLHMTWRNKQGIWYTNAPADRAADARAWRESRFVSGGYFSQLLADSRGRLHMIITDNLYTAACASCFHVYHYYSDDQGVTWSSQSDVSVLPTGAAKPFAALDKSDNLHLVWEAARGGDLGQTNRPKKIAYAASYDRGINWTEPQLFTPGNATTEAANPSIAVDGKGSLVMTYAALSDDFFYSQQSLDGGRSWSAPQRIGGAFNVGALYDARLDTQAMATDGAGRVHLIAIGRTDVNPNADASKSLSVMRFEWDGSAWSPPELITTVDSRAGGDAPQWPALAIGNGNQLHVAWYLRRAAMLPPNERQPPNYEIYYSTARIDAASSAAAPYPTLTPAPTVTVRASVLEPTDVPPQVSTTQTIVTIESLKNEYGVWRILLLSLAPLAALIAIALLRRRTR
jgi:hypothetical protein